MDRMKLGGSKKPDKNENSKSLGSSNESSNDALIKLEGNNNMNNNNKLNFDNKLEIKTNIKSSKDLRNVVLFGDKNEKNQKELKSIAATTLKALSSAVDPTMGALEYIARNDILSKLRGIKTAH